MERATCRGVCEIDEEEVFAVARRRKFTCWRSERGMDMAVVSGERRREKRSEAEWVEGGE